MQIKISNCENVTSRSCHFCEKKALEQVVQVQGAPVFLGCTIKAQAEDAFVSFGMYVCKECGLIQTDAASLETTYAEIHSEALGPTWELHHRAFASYISSQISLPLARKINILEIGASAQPIARGLPVSEKQVYYVDPIQKPPFELSPSEEYFSGFFPSVGPTSKVDLIIASHVLEHIPNTRKFLEAAKSCLHPDGMIFISIPSFYKWFKKFYLNAISAEHITYPFIQQLEVLAQSIGSPFQSECHGEHSLFGFFRNSSKASHLFTTGQNTFLENKKILIDWVAKFNQMVSVSLPQTSSPIFLAGASHLSQYVLLCNPRVQKHIQGVLDNSNKKWGQRLYGTPAKACAFHEVEKYTHPHILLPASPYAVEMRNQILDINPEAVIIELRG